LQRSETSPVTTNTLLLKCLSSGRLIDYNKSVLVVTGDFLYLCDRYVKLKDRKRSLCRKNDHNALWH